MNRTRVLAGVVAAGLLVAASAAWLQARPRMRSHVAARLAERLVRPPGTALWVAGRGSAVQDALRSCDTDLLGSRAPQAAQDEVLVLFARDHLQGVVVSPGPAAADGTLPPTDPVAVLVARDLDTGEDLSGAVAVTAAGADCWAAALPRIDRPRTVRP